MKRSFVLLLVLAIASAEAQISYPVTRKVDSADNYHGTVVADPYRWLEDDNSEETKAWVKEQNKVTFGYLDKIPFRQQVKKRLTELWNYPRYSAPFLEEGYYYFSKNDGLQNQSVWYRQRSLSDKPELFLDPNKLSDDGTVSLASFSFSKSGKFMSYTVQRGGSDWQEAYVMDVRTKKLLKDELKWLKFTGLNWKGDEGFFYSRFPETSADDKLKGRNENQKLYYHKLGTPQSEDQLVFEDPAHPSMIMISAVTEDQRFLVLNLLMGTNGKEIRVKDLTKNDQPFVTLVKGFDHDPSVIDNYGSRFLVHTNEGASNYKIVLLDPYGGSPAKDIVAEKKEVLESARAGGGQIFFSYLKDASTKVFQYTYEGKLVREIKLPGIGTAWGFGGEKKDKEFFYSFSSYNYPTTIFRYDIATGRSALFRKPEVKFRPEDFEVKQVFVTSKDGARVPLFLAYRKGLVLNGQNPTWMYGYGGFNSNETPYFSASNIFFMEQGGVLAHVVLRGGSEYGEEWHKAGMLANKQNVFDDFISSAEWLISNKYTSSSKLAIQGASNGGLLVGAAMTQRPDLFKVVIAQVGVMDMLRYHKFTIGYLWASEYGRSDNPEQFSYLFKYSPLHNLNRGVRYPATLITTADHDDRVVPAHSFKYAAALQEVHAGENPVLIRIDTKAGHGAGMPTSKRIHLAADIWSFIMYNTGMNFKGAGSQTKKTF